MVCFDLIFGHQTIPTVALAAAVSLKNFIRENWVCVLNSFFSNGEYPNLSHT